jgi:hypothetical protein
LQRERPQSKARSFAARKNKNNINKGEN